MDVLTRDGVVIEIGSVAMEVNDPQKYIINGKEYMGFWYRIYQNIDVPDFVKPGVYTFDGVSFNEYKGYFVHDSNNAESINILQAIGNSLPVVDYFADFERNSRLQGISSLPCFVQRLRLGPSSNQQTLTIVTSLANDLAKTRQELAELKAKQADQESMLIECFTDLDASINGGEQNAELG